MNDPATARAQAEKALHEAVSSSEPSRSPAQARSMLDQALDDVARVLKRHQREVREAVQQVRQAQFRAHGIKYTHGPQEGRSGNHTAADQDTQ